MKSAPPIRRLVTYKQLKSDYGVPWHPVHVNRLVNQGKFPGFIRIGRDRLWDRAEVEQFLSEKFAARGDGATENV